MTNQKANELVAKEFPEYIIREVKQSYAVPELVSPTLCSNDAIPDSKDSGIVVIEKKVPDKNSIPKAVVFHKGKIIGHQG